MEINFKEYKPFNLNIRIKKLEKIPEYRYKLEKKEFEDLKKHIEKRDIELEELKKFLFNLKHLKEEEISYWIYKIKFRKPKDRINGLEYIYYAVYLNYYKTENMENIYSAITKLGKQTFNYMISPSKDEEYFLKNIQRLFHKEKNISFFNFIYEEFKKQMLREDNLFYEEFLIEYNSILSKDLLELFLKEIKEKNIKLEKATEYLNFIKKQTRFNTD